MSARPVELTAAASAWERQATASRGLFSWLVRQRISLVASANDTGQLFFIGADEKKGIVFSQAKFSAAAMGLATFSQRLYLATRNQIWRLENALQPGQLANDRFDRLYVPRNSQVTGDFDVHEMAVEDSGRIVVTNTDYSCLATISLTHAFKPIWQPPFISKLAPEDRCHLNGLGLENGKVRVVSLCSRTDIVDGWRHHRADGGVVMDIADNRVLAEGLSMPHSPRLHGGQLWVLNSGSGHLLRIDRATGAREEVVFCPGFLRGLSFAGHFAMMTLSLPKTGRLQGLELGANLEARKAEPWCGLVIVDLRHGGIVEWVRFGPEVPQLFDCAFLENIRCPTALTPGSAEVQDAMTVEVG